MLRREVHGTALAMEHHVALDPLQIRLFRSNTVVALHENAPHPFEQTRVRRGCNGGFDSRTFGVHRLYQRNAVLHEI
jgi:hypothetical protein